MYAQFCQNEKGKKENNQSNPEDSGTEMVISAETWRNISACIHENTSFLKKRIKENEGFFIKRKINDLK